MIDSETLLVIAGLPFYGITVIVTGYVAMYAFNKAKQLDDSAAQQAISELPAGKV